MTKISDVSEWLASLGLGEYADAFRANHIDVETLSSLTMDDLREIGVASVGHRRRILGAIAALAKATGPAPPRAEAPHDGERRQVTVLFADLAGYTTLSSELDAEQAHALLSAFFESADRIIAEFGGHIDKHIGDCVMAVFGVPLAHGDDVRRAVTAGLAIHASMGRVSTAAGRAIAAHVGIASGEVVASRTGSAHYTEFTVTGETVNLASRLTSLARNGETIVSADIVVTLGESIEADFGGSVPVKGLASPVDIWRVRGLSDRQFGSGSLVGRRAELERCEAALGAAREGGTGAILYVRGEPGIGKSAIASESFRRAESLGFAGVRVAVFDFGTALDRDPLRALSLALLEKTTASVNAPEAVGAFATAHRLEQAEALALKDLAGIELSMDERRLLDAISPANRTSARGEVLGKLSIAAASTTPFLVVVEDVHWAEAVALQCLAAMSRMTCTRSRTVVLMTSRVEGDPLSDLRPIWSGLSLVLIELGRLDAEEARSLAENILGVGNPSIDECVARAEGNPLFLEQLIRHATAGGRRAELPGSIRSVVSAQIDRLAAEDKTALYAAAVLGHQFSVDALRTVLGSSEWSPESLVANRLLVVRDDFLQFAHALIRESVYASMLRPERRRLHLAAADWFVGRDTALRAEHLAKAESPAAAKTYLAAIDEQVAQYRVDEAITLSSRAEAVALDAADRCAVKLRQGDLLTEAGRSTDALAAYESALAVAPDDEAEALSMLGTAGVFRLLDRNDEALALLEQAEPVFAAKGRLVELARLEHLRGNLLFPLGRVEACEAAHRRAFDHAERSGSLELQARTLGGLGDSAFASGRFVTSHRRIAECVELARRHGFGRIEIANAIGLGTFSGDADRGLAVIDEAIARAVDARQLRAELTGHHAAMTLSLWAGREESVKGHYERAQMLVEQIGAQRFRALNLTLMGEAHRRLGDRARAAAMHEEALAIARNGGMSYVGPIVLGFRALAAGDDIDSRRESLRDGELVLANGGISLGAVIFYVAAIETCLRSEEWAEAARFADSFEARFALERVPEIEYQVRSGRVLAALRGRAPGDGFLERIRECREAGLRVGYDTRLLDEALQRGEREALRASEDG